MKKLAILTTALTLFLSACAPKFSEQEVVQEKKQQTTKSGYSKI